MNIGAKCASEGCSAFNIEKSMAVGQILGYGAPNDRVTCFFWGGLMTSTQTLNTSAKRRTGKGRSKSISTSRASSGLKGRSPKRSRKQMRKRG
jgi:hypothetical protein